MTPAALAKVTGISSETLGEALEALVHADLVTPDARQAERYSYAPAEPEADQYVRLIADLYDSQRADVLRALADNSVKRLRHATFQAFGQQFRLKV